jgi:hypothetical protein
MSNSKCQHELDQITFKGKPIIEDGYILYPGICACGLKVHHQYNLQSYGVMDAETGELLNETED